MNLNWRVDIWFVTTFFFFCRRCRMLKLVVWHLVSCCAVNHHVPVRFDRNWQKCLRVDYSSCECLSVTDEKWAQSPHLLCLSELAYFKTILHRLMGIFMYHLYHLCYLSPVNVATVIYKPNCLKLVNFSFSIKSKDFIFQ